MLRKKVVCDKCGTIHKGFYVNPICTCENQMRKFEEHEQRLIDIAPSFNDGAKGEFHDWEISDKRSLLRKQEEYIVRPGFPIIMSIIILLVGLSFMTPSLLKQVESIWDILCVVLSHLILVVWIAFAIGRTIYFKILEKKDNKFFQRD